jgi:glucokinase-like ROK family protein
MAFLQTGDQALLRKLNLASVLRLIHTQAPISRVQLANLTQLNKSTISSLVVELIERGLLREAGQDLSGGGRPATHLELNPDAGRMIGIELGVEQISLIIANFTGEVMQRIDHIISPEAGQDKVTETAIELIDEMIHADAIKGSRLLGIGMTLPGMVDVQAGMLVFSPNLRWRNTPLGQIVAQHTGVPVWVDNDANAAALAEHLFGVARKASNFIFLTAGVGFGGGLFLNGELYRGAGGFAGEIGHTGLDLAHNKPCRCGNTGCWENSTNQYALIERVRASLDVGRSSRMTDWMIDQNEPLSLEMIVRAADEGDAVSLDALHDTGEMIGLKVANLVNIFNPEMVVVGGSMSIAGSHLLPAIQSVVDRRALPECRRGLEIQLSAFGPDAGVMGAVALVVRAITEDPTQVAKLS